MGHIECWLSVVDIVLLQGITCLLPVFREGLLTGAPEMKETSALGLSDAIKVASADALKQSVVHITGPLIRVLGDRYGPTVRVAMIDTITVLLVKVLNTWLILVVHPLLYGYCHMVLLKTVFII